MHEKVKFYIGSLILIPEYHCGLQFVNPQIRQWLSCNSHH